VTLTLENWVRGCSRSLKVAPFDRRYTSFYWSAIVPFSSYLALNNIVTLKSGLEVTRADTVTKVSDSSAKVTEELVQMVDDA